MYKFKQCLPFISKNKISSFSTKSYKGNIHLTIQIFFFLIPDCLIENNQSQLQGYVVTI